MEIVGYTDRFSVAPGEQIRFMVSTASPRYQAEIVRLTRGNDQPGQAGIRSEPVVTSLQTEHDDAGWDPDFALTIPDGLHSGVYAAHVTTAGGQDYVPVFVRPANRAATAKTLLLVPTLTYQAYANWHFITDRERLEARGYMYPYPLGDHQRYAIDEHLLSLYERHSDGSGVFYSSRLRPIANLRPDINDEAICGRSRLGAQSEGRPAHRGLAANAGFRLRCGHR